MVISGPVSTPGDRRKGVKDRPCAVILVTADEAGDTLVTVLPIAHRPPADPALAVEIPAAVKRRLRLDQGNRLNGGGSFRRG